MPPRTSSRDARPKRRSGDMEQDREEKNGNEAAKRVKATSRDEEGEVEVSKYVIDASIREQANVIDQETITESVESEGPSEGRRRGAMEIILAKEDSIIDPKDIITDIGLLQREPTPVRQDFPHPGQTFQERSPIRSIAPLIPGAAWSNSIIGRGKGQRLDAEHGSRKAVPFRGDVSSLIESIPPTGDQDSKGNPTGTEAPSSQFSRQTSQVRVQAPISMDHDGDTILDSRNLHRHRSTDGPPKSSAQQYGGLSQEGETVVWSSDAQAGFEATLAGQRGTNTSDGIINEDSDALEEAPNKSVQRHVGSGQGESLVASSSDAEVESRLLTAGQQESRPTASAMYTAAQPLDREKADRLRYIDPSRSLNNEHPLPVGTATTILQPAQPLSADRIELFLRRHSPNKSHFRPDFLAHFTLRDEFLRNYEVPGTERSASVDSVLKLVDKAKELDDARKYEEARAKYEEAVESWVHLIKVVNITPYIWNYRMFFQARADQLKKAIRECKLEQDAEDRISARSGGRQRGLMGGGRMSPPRRSDPVEESKGTSQEENEDDAAEAEERRKREGTPFTNNPYYRSADPPSPAPAPSGIRLRDHRGYADFPDYWNTTKERDLRMADPRYLGQGDIRDEKKEGIWCARGKLFGRRADSLYRTMMETSRPSSQEDKERRRLLLEARRRGTTNEEIWRRLSANMENQMERKRIEREGRARDVETNALLERAKVVENDGKGVDSVEVALNESLQAELEVRMKQHTDQLTKLAGTSDAAGSPSSSAGGAPKQTSASTSPLTSLGTTPSPSGAPNQPTRNLVLKLRPKAPLSAAEMRAACPRRKPAPQIVRIEGKEGTPGEECASCPNEYALSCDEALRLCGRCRGEKYCSQYCAKVDWLDHLTGCEPADDTQQPNGEVCARCGRIEGRDRFGGAGKGKLMACWLKCGVAWYCGLDCEVKHWGEHLELCDVRGNM